jgi:subtilisin family serine protease
LMKQNKKIVIVLVFLLFLGVFGVQALIKQSVTNTSQPATSGGNFLDAKKFHLSPEASGYIFKRYPTGLIPLPLDPKNQKFISGYLSSEGYIIELTNAPSGPGVAAAHNDLLSLKEMSVERENLKAEHKSFLKEMRSVNLGSKVNREYTNVFNGVSVRNISIDELIKIAGMDEVKEIYPLVKYHTLLSDSVGQIGATSVWTMKDSSGNNLTGKGVKIAIVDTGIDYTHPDLGGCTAEQIEGGSISVAGIDYSFESNHPYSDRMNETWNITMPGFSRIAVHFKNISLEGDFDILYVKNSSGDVIKKYTGSLNDVWSDSVKGDTIYLQLVSDGSINDWGFSIDKVINGSTDYSLAGCAKVAYGYDYANNDNNPLDDQGHGTHCASIAAGNGALKGVAPDATLMAYKSLIPAGAATATI